MRPIAADPHGSERVVLITGVEAAPVVGAIAVYSRVSRPRVRTAVLERHPGRYKPAGFNHLYLGVKPGYRWQVWAQSQIVT